MNETVARELALGFINAFEWLSPETKAHVDGRYDFDDKWDPRYVAQVANMRIAYKIAKETLGAKP